MAGRSPSTGVYTFEPSWKDALGCTRQTAATRLRHEAQGWPRFLRPTLGTDAIVPPTLKGLRPDATLSG